MLMTRPTIRSSKRDWESVYEKAKLLDFDNIDKSVVVQHYNNLKKIGSDNMIPPQRQDVTVKIFWGITGSGKSHKAFHEAGEIFYAKPSTNKWWDGYRGQENVVIDEFNGDINIIHLLKWFDKWPCLVETKGGTVPLLATKFWLTSNLHPCNWWEKVSDAHMEALKRRVEIIEFVLPYHSS